MKTSVSRWLLLLLVCLVACPLLASSVMASAPESSAAPVSSTAPVQEPTDQGPAYDRICPYCQGTMMTPGGECGECDQGHIYSDSNFFGTAWALLPPIVAIVLALITKEVYSSLFVGILTGGLLYSNFNLEGAYNAVVKDGFIASLADPGDAGILMFLVILGIIVVLFIAFNILLFRKSLFKKKP